MFALPLTTIKTSILFPDQGEFSLTDLINHTSSIVEADLENSYTKLIDVFQTTTYPLYAELLKDWYERTKSKARTRTSIQYQSGDKISLSVVKNNYICSHFNAADLSMFSDFNSFKENLQIVGKSFVTLGLPLKHLGYNLYFRDTMLLAPAGVKSLDSIGKMYDVGIQKVDISRNDLQHMDEFLKRDKDSFEQYAKTDAILTLTHAVAMETYNFTINQLGVPLTISSIGKNLVFHE